MSVDDRHLIFRGRFAGFGDSSEIEGRGKPRAVCAGLAMNQQRLRCIAHDLDELSCLFPGQFATGRHLEVDVVDIEFLRLGDFAVIPSATVVFAAQIDDGLDTILLLQFGDRRRRWLRRAVDLAGDDGMEVRRP